jgi:hypothetical protein
LLAVFVNWIALGFPGDDLNCSKNRGSDIFELSLTPTRPALYMKIFP